MDEGEEVEMMISKSYSTKLWRKLVMDSVDAVVLGSFLVAWYVYHELSGLSTVNSRWQSGVWVRIELLSQSNRVISSPILEIDGLIVMIGFLQASEFGHGVVERLITSAELPDLTPD